MSAIASALLRADSGVLDASAPRGSSLEYRPYDIVEKIRCEAKHGLDGIPLGHPILKHTAIGYDFTFEMTEKNDLTNGALQFDRKGFRTGSNFGLDFSGSATRERKNKRQFRIVESLEKLNRTRLLGRRDPGQLDLPDHRFHRHG